MKEQEASYTTTMGLPCTSASPIMNTGQSFGVAKKELP
jgi:hypothetical protein